MFGRKKSTNDSRAEISTPKTVSAQKPVRLADAETYARVSDSQSPLTVVIDSFAMSVIRLPTDDGVEVSLPTVALYLNPGGPIDFADPVIGFPGMATDPPPGRVLRVWADDVLTISHDGAWTFVLDASEQFEQWWLDLMFPPPNSKQFIPNQAAIMIFFGGPLAAGTEATLGELDPTSPSMRVHIEDQRSS